MRTRNALSALGFLLAVGASTPAMAAATWTPYFSDGTNPFWQACPRSGEAVSGIRCSGSYCDNVSIRCQTLPYGISNSNYAWAHWFSEEDSNLITHLSVPSPPAWYGPTIYGNQHVCHQGEGAGVMTGMACAGSYCDNILLQCAIPETNVGGDVQPVELTNCFWSAPYSEEDPWFAYGATANKWISGVECFDSYCDDKSYYVCEMQPAANSCLDHCGGTSRDLTCFCDSLCTQYNDCCDDYAAAC